MINVSVTIWPRCAPCGAPLEPNGENIQGGVIYLLPCARCEDKMKKKAFLEGEIHEKEKGKTAEEKAQQEEDDDWSEEGKVWPED